jgi:hypothetical protein
LGRKLGIDLVDAEIMAVGFYELKAAAVSST